MSKWRPGKEFDTALPPGWTALAASTPAGDMYLSVWQEFPDASPFEYECALGVPGVVKALREARGERLDLSDNHWQRLIRRVLPHMTYEQRLSASEILEELALTYPKPPGRAHSPADLANSAPGRKKSGPPLIVTRAEVEECRTALIAVGKPHGYEALAKALAVSLSTVRRRLRGN